MTPPKGKGKLKPFEDYLATNSDMQAHLQRLHDMTLELDAQVVVELGVRYGMSSAAFLHALHATGGHLWSVEHEHDQPYLDTSWTFIPGNDLAPVVQAQIPESIDLLFIDTEHTIWQTPAELLFYGTRVRPGGLIVCHDTWRRGVSFPLREFFLEAGTEYREWRESYGLGVVTVGDDHESVKHREL